MKSTMQIGVAGTMVVMLFGSTVMAQSTDEVQVQASRAVQTKIVGRDEHNVPIREISLGYGVSLTGIDLTSANGAAEAQKRINDAALAACKEISRQYPSARPDDSTCAKSAANEAMSKVHTLIAAARKNAAK
jgi:UrcA family protein